MIGVLTFPWRTTVDVYTGRKFRWNTTCLVHYGRWVSLVVPMRSPLRGAGFGDYLDASRCRTALLEELNPGLDVPTLLALAMPDLLPLPAGRRR